jgi:hypothetical protein
MPRIRSPDNDHPPDRNALEDALLPRPVRHSGGRALACPRSLKVEFGGRFIMAVTAA